VHDLSHHHFPNTVMDLEVSALEDFLVFLPYGDKRWWQRYFMWPLVPLVLAAAMPLQVPIRLVAWLRREESPRPEHLLPLAMLLIGVFLRGGFLPALPLYMTVQLAASFAFAFAGLISSHHNPDCWHDGDAARLGTRDFGILQLDAVRERREVEGASLLWVLTGYGHHGLHHLFPTVDHAQLPQLQPVFEETLREFGLEYKVRIFYTSFSL